MSMTSPSRPITISSAKIRSVWVNRCARKIRRPSPAVALISSATTTKFWADAARQGVSLPWAVYEEVEGDLTYMTAAGGITSSLDSGKVRFLIVAEGKKTARDLGRMVTTVLNDAPLAFADGTLMLLRARKPFFVPVAKVAPHCPNAYARVIVFDQFTEFAVVGNRLPLVLAHRPYVAIHIE